MTHPDYRGARGSNAGDDFHELWVLRQALALLDEGIGLTAVTVEGLMAEDESGTPSDTWDGVDCAFYFGSEDISSVEHIEIDQLKYSSANPNEAWTIARLTLSSNKKRDNSVIARLAKAFGGLKEKRSDLIADGNVLIRLVSNQPVDPRVLTALSNSDSLDPESKEATLRQSDRAALRAASGLRDDDFDAFAMSLDLSECGHGSRFALEERVLTVISEWTDDDARTSVIDLLRFVRLAMMPEAKGEFITRHSILSRLGFSDPAALFPCRSEIKIVERLISRDAIRIATEQMLVGAQRICLHGEGGCGKTTALQEIESLLPSGSVVLIFDCYGGGRYLDSDAYRHRPTDAFLQLSNDLARLLRTPLLVSRSPDLNYPRVFKKRLEKAAEVVASEAKDSLLVVVIDAADNSITAAKTRSPEERSFVPDFFTLGDLPANVRLFVTGRSGRLATLDLPPSFTLIEIKGFELDETAAHVQVVWKEAPDDWIEDFHDLSGGNPRVQRYALDHAGAEPALALDYLRPRGKSLDDVFGEQLNHARQKVGQYHDIKVFCAGFVALPRPIPLEHLSAVTGLSESHLRDLCADLAPGVRLSGGAAGFADEDFEHFMRSEAETQLVSIRGRIATHFLGHHKLDAYAASHVAAALLEAGRGPEIIELINSEPEPTAIRDPVLRREAQLQRLKIAMKVCRETGNDVDAMLTLLIGAEALKTDAAISRMLVENPDLAANFARETSSRIVLRDSDQIENHGPLLFHLAAADALGGDAISVREGLRQLGAWMQRRKEDLKEQKEKNPGYARREWQIGAHDIAAETEAVLRIAGPGVALRRVRSWSPRYVALQVAMILSSKLITSGDAELVESCLNAGGVPKPWDLFLLTRLAIAGKPIDISRLESSLASLVRHRLVRIDALRDTWSKEDPTAAYLEMVLTACEVIVCRGGNRASVIPALELIAAPEVRRRDRLRTSQALLIDLSLRAHFLVERLAGRQPTVTTYLVNPPEPANEIPAKEGTLPKKSVGEKKEEIETFVEPFVELYDVRAQLLLGMIRAEAGNDNVRNAVSRSHQEEYRLRRDYQLSGIRTRAALSLTRLLILPNFDRASLLEHSRAILRSGPFDAAESEILGSLAIERSLQPQILNAITTLVQSIKGTRTSAEEKITALARMARLALPISYYDAESIFNDAVAVASEINAEAIYEIGLFAPLVKRAAGIMERNRKRRVGQNLAIIVSDAAVRLEGQDNFPWDKAAEALTNLDVCIALAATGRWEDAAIVDRATFLLPTLKTALSRRELSAAQVTALSPLFDELEIELLERVLAAAKDEGIADINALSEELAREELLRFGQGRREKVSEKLDSVQSGEVRGFWLGRLLEATTFHNIQTTHPAKSGRDSEPSGRSAQVQAKNDDQLNSIDWAAHRFISQEEINEVIDQVLTAAQASETFIPVSAILERIGREVAFRDRVPHLEALRRIRSVKVGDYEIGHAIARLMAAWGEVQSAASWGRAYVLRLVMDRLSGLIGYLKYGDSPLMDLLKQSNAPDVVICAGLIEATERHVESLDAPTVYALVGLIGQYCAPDDAAKVCERYSERLVKRIPIADRDKWDLADVPYDPVDGLARYLYALMGDLDLRNRWRAAHVARSLARLGASDTLDHIVELYPRMSEPSYRIPEAPFYWLASRLWLVLALDRIASETPLAVGHHTERLLKIASDTAFPHVIIRSYAKSAVLKLVERGEVTLEADQLAALKRANTSTIPRKKPPKSHDPTFERYRGTKENRRFTFNSMDTLPYWYSGAVTSFADVNKEEFLDVVERWIVDRWGVRSDPWMWEAEPRKGRLSQRALSDGSHSHGSLPVGERFNTHLEWHAMWCAIGELMKTHPLAKVQEDSYRSFESHLGHADLTAPPLWLADLRSMKPLEKRLWIRPREDIDTWVEDAHDEDFLMELQCADDGEAIVVGCDHETRSRNFDLIASVDTALVSPGTAGALMRALQTIEDPLDYRIPPAGDDLEINLRPYRLEGWLDEKYQDLGIDERDPFRYDVRSIQCVPSSEVASSLNLKFVYENQPKWLDAGHSVALSYESWSDIRWDDYDDVFLYRDEIRSSGWRLRIDKRALAKFLEKAGLDLIVEIRIRRKNKGYEYSRHHEKETKEAEFERILLLRRDGIIEAAERRFGSWKTSRA